MVQLLVVALAIASVLAAVSTAFSWQKQDSTAEAWMAVTLLVITIWSLLHVLLFTLDSFRLLFAVASVLYPIAPYIAISVFLFVVYFTGREQHLSRGRLTAILVFPVTLLPVTLSEYWLRHELAFVDLSSCTGDCGGTALTYSFGPALYLYAGASYVFAAIASYLIYLKVRRSRNVYRKLSLNVLAITVVLMSATIATFLGLSPYPHMVLLPLAFLVFGISTVGITASVRFVQFSPIDAIFTRLSSLFGDIVPLARDVVIEEIDSGVIVLDEQNRIVDVNTKGKQILAPDGSRVVGKQLTEIISTEQLPPEFAELLDPGVTGRYEAVWVEGDDKIERCYDISITELDPSEAEPTSSRVALVHDVTDRERRKQKLEAQKRTLEAQNERLDDFASMVSHDLRNPLNVAEGYVETIEAEVDDESTVAEYAEEVSVSHRRMREIIEDVLVLARQGQSIEETEPLDLAALSVTAWGTVDTESATLDTDTVDGGTVDANRSSLLRLLENLFRNAIDHNPEPASTGDLTVRVGLLPDSDGFYVEDSGAGIPPDEREQVLEHAYTTSAEGTGFGLSIVDEIADGHGWSIEVTAGDDGGARFEFHGVTVGSTAS